MDADPQVALPDPGGDGLVVRVNFGILAGRQATPAELDDLGRTLVREFGDVTVVAEERFEVGQHSEAELHQIRIELDEPAVDTELRQRLLETTERWARACADDRGAEVPEI